jgi:hypothetical protein
MSYPLSAMLMTIVLIVAGTPVTAGETTVPQTLSKKSIESPNVGVFTGRIVNGMPVYQLPPISVIANRKVELAKAQREAEPPRNKQVRAKGVARGPA